MTLGWKHYGRYVDDFYYVVSEEDLPQAKRDIEAIRKFLNGGSNDLGITFQRDCEVGRGTFIIHYTNQARLMLHPRNRRLKLSVDDYAVGNDNNIIKNNLIVFIMQRSKTISCPSNRI